MAVTKAFTYTTRMGESVDEVARRFYGTDVATSEWLYETNPGLASHGVKLPSGVQIFVSPMPADDAATATPQRLWSR